MLRRLSTSISEFAIEQNRVIESFLISMQYISFSYVDGHTQFLDFNRSDYPLADYELSYFILDLCASFSTMSVSISTPIVGFCYWRNPA
jgi:hypothetical protein